MALSLYRFHASSGVHRIGVYEELLMTKLNALINRMTQATGQNATLCRRGAAKLMQQRDLIGELQARLNPPKQQELDLNDTRSE